MLSFLARGVSALSSIYCRALEASLNPDPWLLFFSSACLNRFRAHGTTAPLEIFKLCMVRFDGLDLTTWVTFVTFSGTIAMPPFCSLFVVSTVRRDAGNDRRRAVTPARNGAESPDEEDLPVRDDSTSVNTDFAGRVSGDHKRRALVLGFSGLAAGTANPPPPLPP